MSRSDKIDHIAHYIERANQILANKDVDAAKEFCDDVIAVFSVEIDQLTQNLTRYWAFDSSDINYLKDVKTLKVQLENYSVNIQAGFVKQVPNSNENGGTHIDIKNDVNNQISINLSFDQTIDQISQMSEDQLSQAEKDKLKSELLDVNMAQRRGESKKSIWEKVKPILELLITKGADVAMTAMPYIIEVLQKAG